MSLFSFISKQFVDVIQWTEPEAGVLAYRYPMQDQEIQNGAQLVVREMQRAMFLDEGKFADKFEAGTYTLNTNTLPVLTNLRNWDKFFESPYKADVYFFSLREQIDQKWGTPQPVTVRDKEFGALRIRAHGIYSYRLTDPEKFWTKLVTNADRFTVSELDGQLRSLIMTSMAAALGRSPVPFVDMAAQQDVLSKQLQDAIAPAFLDYGLELRSYFVQSISLPEELQQHLDKAAQIRMVGELGRYTQFQTADSIPAAAANPGGTAAVGAGLGVGVAMGQAMMGAMNAGVPNAASKEDPFALIEKLGDLLKKGLISQEEFDKKKAELLGRIG
ncbi:MAG: SPFH domain-containing protein [Gammaproteobacteria bacterium]|nr:SPFH domain-containing protein [Gammaproteobacteria bacterium]